MTSFNERLQTVFEELNEPFEMVGYRHVADRLSEVVGQNPKWSPRYIQSLVSGTIEPSIIINRAVEILEATLDGTRLELASARSTNVLVNQHAEVVPGTYIRISSRYCRQCGMSFVPNSSLRKYCQLCRPSRKRART